MSSKICITIVFLFSWDLQWSQEKLKTILMQNSGGTKRVLWCFWYWLISLRKCAFVLNLYNLCTKNKNYNILNQLYFWAKSTTFYSSTNKGRTEKSCWKRWRNTNHNIALPIQREEKRIRSSWSTGFLKGISG